MIIVVLDKKGFSGTHFVVDKMQLLWIKYLYLWKASDGYQWPGITTGNHELS